MSLTPHVAWYPRGHFNNNLENDNANDDDDMEAVEPLPVLGIDLIQLSNCFLIVVDLQPLYDENNSNNNIHNNNHNNKNMVKKQLPHIQEVWEEMPSILKSKMSTRFYNETQFFLQNMIFGRFSKPEN